jgi:hypothetical protein
MAKPASGTALDTGHALYTNLTHVWALLEGTGTTIADSRGTNTGTLRSSGLWTTDSEGAIVRETDGTQRTIALGSTVTLGSSNANWSIAFAAKQTTGNNNGMFVGPNNAQAAYVWLRDANYLRFQDSAANGANFTGVTTFTTRANYVLTHEFESGVTDHIRLYKDGSLISDEQRPAGYDTLAFDTIGNGWTLADDLGLEGDISYLYVWAGRLLNLTEVGTIHTNPYAIFTGGGGGGLSIPVAMNQYRQRWA